MMAKKDVKKDKKASVWMLSADGEPSISDEGDAKPSHLKTQMDTLGAKGKTMVIETENDEVLRRSAEYALQKRYDLVSALPEQNLKIQQIQNALSPEKEISGGELAPSITVQKKLGYEATNSDGQHAEKTTPKKQGLAKGKATPKKTTAEVGESAEEITADIQRMAEAPLPQTSMDPTKKKQELEEENQAPNRDSPTQVPFPEKRPAEVLSHRLMIPTVKDHGNRLVVTRMGMMATTPPQFRERDELIAKTLMAARERFGEPVRVTGHGAIAGRFFEDAVIKAAIAQGIPLEMASDRGEKAYAKALGKHQESILKKDIGSLGPSKQQEQKKEQGHGRELEF
ncbi:hypothetical protein A6M27_02800 [Acidithiobacillus thiooxidans]|uniref:Large polyvalent protein-associated domain-containing protein n=1 Tax=Acidithiobacillus thiooxidans TaxID=930 RepID=A0A1C2IRB3_ACITH|nr:hypothetical protein [Acidithiobacillus thiooxidans]OCX72286.1 hypothetical protein A6O24_14190 [Acidithiobacillus thiooxidans]OCX76251.1 hypothetical protein A6P07_02850 [Acidithiobacillus thiooxidans]OCX78497.1 hypothetical protein A6O26_18110 [Acidithiobacillus thiooxidans]OCX89278.1 hypothetical protein A6M27_02800 [Acidithiobacillus thiooxidans]OFC49112.1 hypothetical protein BAE47_06035 [Acidithiobacillus thiooxidans]